MGDRSPHSAASGISKRSPTSLGADTVLRESVCEHYGRLALDFIRRHRHEKALVCLKRAYDACADFHPRKRPEKVLERVRALLALCACQSMNNAHHQALVHATAAKDDADALRMLSEELELSERFVQ